MRYEQQTCKEHPSANSIACPDDVNNFVQTRLGGELFEHMTSSCIRPIAIPLLLLTDI